MHGAAIDRHGLGMEPAVYILASQMRGTLYVGVTSNIVQRIHQHRSGEMGGFTARHGVTRLVYLEACPDMASAIAREKTLKRWRRDWKIELIEQANPSWRDLGIDLGFPPLSPRTARQAPRMDPGSSPG